METEHQLVDPTGWLATFAGLLDQGLSYFDFLAAVDYPDDEQIEVIGHVMGRGLDGSWRGVQVRTRLDRADPKLDTLTGLCAGADWHEREVQEMFGVDFGRDRRPLLLTGVEDLPLRKTTPLRARLETPWPGAIDPGDRPAAGLPTGPRRRAPKTPGVPAQWLP